MFALKQFRHYLLGRHFKILTDHAPLQWLSAQKMEGMLCRWALVLQEYDFDIDFRKGKQNVNADALSHRYSPCAITQVESHLPLTEIRTSQPWEPPWAEHYCTPSESSNIPTRRYPMRGSRRPPDRFGLGRVVLTDT